jgi:hypothetical protein
VRALLQLELAGDRRTRFSSFFYLCVGLVGFFGPQLGPLFLFPILSTQLESPWEIDPASALAGGLR